MSDVSMRLAEIEDKLKRVTDELEILQVIAAYGIAADSMSGDAYQNLYTQDCIFDVPGVDHWEGAQEMKRLITTDPRHHALLNRGAAHVNSLPHIQIDGDKAIVTGYSRLYQSKEGPVHAMGSRGMDVLRVSAVRNEMVRGPKGWQIKKRTVLLLDGSEAPRKLLGSAFATDGSN